MSRLLFVFTVVFTVLVILTLYHLDVDTVGYQLTRPKNEYSLLTKTPNKLPSKMGRGYVLTMNYTGQQVAGLRGLLSQMCWIGTHNLPMVVVEPFMVDSFLGFDTMRMRMDLRLSRFYNLTYFNQKLVKNAKLTHLVDWEDFLANAPRKLIILNIDIQLKSVPNCLNYTESICNKHRHLQKKNYTRLASGCNMKYPILVTSTRYLQKLGFQIVRSVCINCKYSMLPGYGLCPEDIRDYIFGDFDPNEVTLLITKWKFSFQTCQKSACQYDIIDVFKHSRQLNLDAQNYCGNLHNVSCTAERSTIVKSKVVAIMIRIEWFLIQYKENTVDNVQRCLHTLLNIYNSDKIVSTGTTKYPVLALDIGEYGSRSFGSTLEKRNISSAYLNTVVTTIKNFVAELYEGRLTFEEWEESYSEAAGGVKDRGYIASLQGAVMSNADCLILMGGGHFQQMVLDQYLKKLLEVNHTIPCLHQVCVPKTFKHVNIQILQKYGISHPEMYTHE